jgi:dienelactone hydrolase
MPGALARFPRWNSSISIIAHALLAFILSAATGQAADQKISRITSHAKDTQTINGYLLRPKGKGPFPAVVALHGCGGLWKRNSRVLTSRHADWGKRLQKAGYVILFPDSFGSRGQSSLCKIKKRPVKHSHRVGDVRGAADWLSIQPFVNRDKIALLGWSNGGTSLLWSLDPDKAPKTTDFKTAIGFYPGCRLVAKKTTWQPRLKPLILMGAADDWTSPVPCKTLTNRWGARLVLYKGAYHSFDTPNSRVRILKNRAYSANGDGIVHIGTNHRARRQAISEVMAHLKAVFSASP